MLDGEEGAVEPEVAGPQAWSRRRPMSGFHRSHVAVPSASRASSLSWPPIGAARNRRSRPLTTRRRALVQLTLHHRFRLPRTSRSLAQVSRHQPPAFRASSHLPCCSSAPTLGRKRSEAAVVHPAMPHVQRKKDELHLGWTADVGPAHRRFGREFEARGKRRRCDEEAVGEDEGVAAGSHDLAEDGDREEAQQPRRQRHCQGKEAKVEAATRAAKGSRCRWRRRFAGSDREEEEERSRFDVKGARGDWKAAEEDERIPAEAAADKRQSARSSTVVARGAFSGRRQCISIHTERT